MFIRLKRSPLQEKQSIASHYKSFQEEKAPIKHWLQLAPADKYTMQEK